MAYFDIVLFGCSVVSKLMYVFHVSVSCVPSGPHLTVSVPNTGYRNVMSVVCSWKHANRIARDVLTDRNLLGSSSQLRRCEFFRRPTNSRPRGTEHMNEHMLVID